MFISRKDGSALFTLDSDRYDFRVEPTGGLRCRCALLRYQSKLILLIAGDFILFSENLSRLTHQHLRHRAEESVAIHAIDNLLIAEAISPACPFEIKRHP